MKCMSVNGIVRSIFFFILVLPWLSAALPAQSAEPQRLAEIRPTETPPHIDGRIDDSCWREAAIPGGFVQYDPVNGVPASEETRVWLTYDRKNIYFAFHLRDTQSKRIWAELTPRNDYENNDAITVILDTYNDQRTSIRFTVNAKGVQKNTVDTIWRSAAVILADGWSAEIAIPFKSLRFTTDDNQVWGINFERYIHRLSETDYWTRVERDKPFLQQMGRLVGLRGIRPGQNLEFFPYLGFRSSRQTDDATKKDDKVAYGLDFKYGITPNLILDITASPDFSEVESDPFIYQLSPYENFFQENRPFFSEGGQYFVASGESGYMWSSPYRLFYSRRIANPRLAAKVTGKSAGWSFGVLGALNDEDVGPDAGYSVVRVQKDILRNSQVGIYLTDMERRGDYNRNLALDFNVNFGDYYYLRGLSVLSLNKDRPRRQNAMHYLQFQRETDTGWQWDLSLRRVERNVDLRTGFTAQSDVQNTSLDIGYAWRYNSGTLQRWSLIAMPSLKHDGGGRPMGEEIGLGSWITFFNNLEIDVAARIGRSKYQVTGEDGSLVWCDTYIPIRRFSVDAFWFRGGFLKEVRLEFGLAKGGIYNEEFTRVEPGRETTLETEVTLRPLDNLQLAGEIGWTRQTLDRRGQEVFDGMTYSTTLHYQVNRCLFFTSRWLGETLNDQFNLDLVAGYHFGAGNIVQLAYKKSRRDEFGRRIDAHTITLKISYLLRV